MKIGVQTKNVINDDNPKEGFALLKRVGFSCADFSLNGYLNNEALYRGEINSFFDRTVQELEHFFTPHKMGANAADNGVSKLLSCMG